MTTLLIILLLIAALVVMPSLALYTIVLRKRNRTQVGQITRLLADLESRAETIGTLGRNAEWCQRDLDARGRRIAQYVEAVKAKNEQITLLQGQVREGAQMMLAAAAEIEQLRAERELVRTRELPQLSDIRNGIEEASRKSDLVRA